MSDHPPTGDEFSAVANWSQAYLELQHSREVGQAFGRLLRTLSEIAVAPRDGIDRFDWLKGRETVVAQELRSLARAVAESQKRREAQRGDGPATAPGQHTKLFVYGTLKRGHSRSAALAGQTFLDVVATAPRYRIFDCGGYPGLVEVIRGVAVEGELWEVDAGGLTQLDEIEGVALNLYARQRILLAPPWQQEVVESYFYQRSVLGLQDCGTTWPVQATP